MTYRTPSRDCDCGCGAEVIVRGIATTPFWNHPDEGGKYFASEACKQAYLQAQAVQCRTTGCETWIPKGQDSFCPYHGKLLVEAENGSPTPTAHP